MDQFLDPVSEGLIFERLSPFLKHLVELSDSIAQLARITLVEESLPKSVYLRLIHSVHSLPLRRLSFCFPLLGTGSACYTSD